MRASIPRVAGRSRERGIASCTIGYAGNVGEGALEAEAGTKLAPEPPRYEPLRALCFR